MNRFLKISLVSFALIVSVGFFAPVVHATTGEPSCAYVGSEGNPCIGYAGNGYCNAAGSCQPSSAAPGVAASAAPAPSAAAGASPVGNISTDYKASDDDAQYGWVMQKIMSLFAWLVGAAALTLDYSVYYTVVSMGGYVSQLTAIGTTWRILRDLGNIMLIFGFLAIGITTVLNVDWYGGGKKMLPMLIVAAVFLNFSLFFAEAVVDVGNLFATQFYTQINGGKMPTRDFLNNVNVSNEGISNKLMDVLGLATIYGAAQNSNTTAAELFKKGNPWLIGFMGILLFIVTAFVMFALAFVLIARFIILIFLLVLAPVGFAGLAIPQLKRRATQWWSTLFEQTVTAPILLLMLYVALAVITDAQFLTGFSSSSAATAGAWTGFVNNSNLGGFAGLLLSFMVAMGLLIAVVIQSKSLSAFGSSFVMKAGNSLTSSAKKMAMAPVKFTGRQTANLARWTGKQTGGRIMTGASRAIMTSTFGGSQAGRIAATTLGKGGAGFVGLEKATEKKHDEYVTARGEAFEKKASPAITDAARSRSWKEEVVKETGGKDEAANAALAEAKAREGELNKNLKEEKKKATIAYAENIQMPVEWDDPKTWARSFVSGTHSSAASNKVIKNALKQMSADDQLLKAVKEAAKKAAEAEVESSKGVTKANEKLAEKVETETKPS